MKPTFPEGRDPHRDLFSDNIIQDITSLAGAIGDNERRALQSDLREVAFAYMTAIYTTPLRLSEGPKAEKLSARVRHLERHVIKPANLILEALTEENAPLLSEWPENLTMPVPNRKVLISELKKLHDRAFELHALINDRLPNENLTQEFLTDLGNALSSVLKSHFPDLTISRGTYFKTENPDDPTMHGPYLSVMEICFKEILPDDKSLSSKLIGEMRKLQGP